MIETKRFKPTKSADQQRCGWCGRQVADSSQIMEMHAVSHCCEATDH